MPCKVVVLEGPIHSGKTSLCQQLARDGFTILEESDRISRFSLRLEKKSLKEIGIKNYLLYQKEHIDICLNIHSELASDFNGTIIIDRDLLSGLMFVKWRLPGYYKDVRNYLITKVFNQNLDIEFRIAFLCPYLKMLNVDEDHRMKGDLSIDTIESQLKVLIDILQDDLVKEILLKRYYHSPEMRVFRKRESLKEDFIKWLTES